MVRKTISRILWNRVIGYLNSKKAEDEFSVIVSFHNSEQKSTKIPKFPKFLEILAENSVIPENFRREFLGWRIPGIPEWEFLVALLYIAHRQ